MNLIDGDKYERRFKKLIGDLNTYREDDIKYFEITERISYLVGEMIGHIDALEINKTSSTP